MAGFGWFLVGTVGSLAWFVSAAVLVSRPFVRRSLLAASLLLAVGVITFVPQVVVGGAAGMYLFATVLGAVLLGVAVIARIAGLHVSVGGTATTALDRYVGTAGVSYATAGSIGIVLGPEVLSLVFMIVAAVTLLLLYLFS